MPQADSGYLPKLRNFQNLFDERVAVALKILGRTSPAGIAVSRYRQVLAGAVDELAGLYTAAFIDQDLPAEKRADLTTLEGNIAMATQQNLEIMRRMIKTRSGRSPRAMTDVRLRYLTRWMSRTTSSLEVRGNVPFSWRVSIPQLLEAGRKPLGTLRSLIVSSLMRRPIAEMFRGLDTSNFLRTDDVLFEGVESTLDELKKYPRRVLVIVSNHDVGVFDGTVWQRLAALLGSQHHISMTRKGVYPLPPPVDAGDVVYVDESDPRHRPVADSVRIVRESLMHHDCVSLAMAPEGMMPFTGAQIPLITKEGAYIIARRLAVELEDLGAVVVMIEGVTNFLHHLTEREIQPSRFQITNVTVVPSQKVEKGAVDEWVSQHRTDCERQFNRDRGERMLNILSAKPLPGSMTYAADPLGVLSAESPLHG